MAAGEVRVTIWCYPDDPMTKAATPAPARPVRHRAALLLAALPALALGGCGSSDSRIAALEQRVAAAEARAEAADQRARKAEQLAMQPTAAPAPIAEVPDQSGDASPDLDVNHPPDEDAPLDPNAGIEQAGAQGQNNNG